MGFIQIYIYFMNHMRGQSDLTFTTLFLFRFVHSRDTSGLTISTKMYEISLFRLLRVLSGGPAM